MYHSSAALILLNTPIGDSRELTLEAMEVLKEESIFFVEDTRAFKSMLSRYEIPLKDQLIRSFHDHSTEADLDKILGYWSEGKTVVYASEAGSPIISDPGLALVRQAINRKVELRSVSGVSSVIKALELSGLPAIPFHFHGFLPKKKGPRKKHLEALGAFLGTHIIFLAKHNLGEVLAECSQLFFGKAAVICREMSKKFESVYRGNIENLSELIEESERRGEFVLLIYIDSVRQGSSSDTTIADLAKQIVETGAKPKRLSKLLGLILEKSQDEIYGTLYKDRQK